MNWPGVCNINSSLNVRASFFCFLLHFLFAFAVSRNAPFDPSHRFVLFFCRARLLGGLPALFLLTVIVLRICAVATDWACAALGEPRQSLEPAEA